MALGINQPAATRQHYIEGQLKVEISWPAVAAAFPTYGAAALLTLRIGAIGIIGALLLGTICALIQHARVPVLHRLVGGYVELSRNTPLLIQLFFLYYGLPKLGLTWSAFSCAIIGLIFLGGGYMSEALRSGLEAISPGQRASALALGMTPAQVQRRVLLPQAIALAVPALAANIIFLMKETSVVSVIALADLVYTAKEHIGNTYQTQEALLLLVVCYLAILVPIALGLRWLERKVRHAGFGN